MELKTIISEIYVDNYEEVFTLLDKYQISQTIDRTIEIIKQHENNPSQDINISTLVSAYLTGVNSKLSAIKEVDDKRKLEYIISGISRQLIFTALNTNAKPLKESVTELNQSLETTCKINGYNFEELKTYLHFDTIVDMANISNSKPERITLQSSPLYYEWLAPSYELDEIVRNLKSEKHISSVKEFKQLFQAHNGEIKIQVDRESLDFIIVLFDVLKLNGKIKPKGQNGHFGPLTKYLVDFENKILINKMPKQIKYTINKNKNKSTILYSKANKWIGISNP